MPIYEYECMDCGKEFTAIETISEHRPGKKVTCPKCESKNVERRWTSVSVTTSKKS